MRKIIKVVVLAALTGSVAWAQPSALPSGVDFQADIGSPVNDVSGRFGTAVDDYLDVTAWSGVEFNSVYFFLGGKAGVAPNGIQGGFATRLAGNYLALYYNGTLTDGSGNDDGVSDSNRLHTVNGSLTWDTSLAFLFGSEAIGGVRLDLLINGPAADRETAAGKQTWWGDSGQQLTTTLQWGKPLGSLTPSVMLGFIWPETITYEPASGSKSEYWNNAMLGFTIGADIGDLSLENHLVINFGDTTKTDAGTQTNSGWFTDRLRVGYGVTLDLTEKFQFKLRPRLTLRIGGQDYKTTPFQGDAYNSQAPQFAFAVSPDVELALKYQRSERLAFYTGLNFRLLQFTALFESSYKDQGGNQYDNKPVTWRFEGISFGNVGNILNSTDLEIAATFKFNDALSLEASLSTDLLDLGIPGSSTNTSFGLNNPFDMQNVSRWITAGSLVFNVRF